LPVIHRAQKDVLAHIAPSRRCFGLFVVNELQPLAHLLNTHVHQAGEPIHAATFVGTPIGAQISFFKAMHADVQLSGGINCCLVQGTRVTINNQVSDAVAQEFSTNSPQLSWGFV